jgi:Tfp pilus assembly protein PilZ
MVTWDAGMNIVKLRLRSQQEWDDLFQPDLPNGGLFVPTTSALRVGEVILVEVLAAQLPNKVLVRMTVQSWRSALPRLRVRAGAIASFDDSELVKRDFIRDVLAGRRTTFARRRQTRLPISVPVRYRSGTSPIFFDSAMTEISLGGALISTASPLPVDSDLVVEVIPPGGAGAISISGKVSYQINSGGTGVRFLSRDSDGTRRLRELVRRLRVQ